MLQQAGEVMQLETKRLIIRNWKETDVDDLMDGLNNIHVSKWLAVVPFPYSRQHAAQWIDYCMQNDAGNNKNGHEFCIELKSTHEVIGGIGVSGISKRNGTAGGGIWINERFHGNGYGREALAEKIRFCFDDLGLRKLENGFFPGNASSQLLHEKLGFKIEGNRRQKYLCMADDELKDEILTGLLKHEWIKE